MKREDISKAVGNISTRYIQEAGEYTASRKRVKSFRKLAARAAVAAAAVMVLCFLAWRIGMHRPFHPMSVNAYAYGTDEEITAAGAVIHTGTISDDGEMKGLPLMFYLSGSNIEKVRFSCKNQQLSFRDWTEKRDEFGLARNFTVPYGEDESEYYYLTVDWEPNDIIRELTDHEDSTIATLPDKMREDTIVMEVAFANGESAVKAIFISLQDDGTFFARFEDYQISDADDFVKRTDALTLRELSKRKEEEIKESKSSDAPDSTVAPDSTAAPDAIEAAKEYYSGTVFEVISMEAAKCTENKIVFSVCVSRDGVIQEPNRRITLKRKGGKWKVTGEGY